MDLPLIGKGKKKVGGVSAPTEINPVYVSGLLTHNEKKAILNIFILFMIIN